MKDRERHTQSYNEMSWEIKSRLFNPQWVRCAKKTKNHCFFPTPTRVWPCVCVRACVLQANCFGRLNSTLGNCSHWHGSSHEAAMSVQTEIKGCERWGLNLTVFGRWLEDKRLHETELLIAPSVPYLEAFVVFVCCLINENMFANTHDVSTAVVCWRHIQRLQNKLERICFEEALVNN